MCTGETKSPPLLVKIQSIDITNLDFQCGTGVSSKSRHVTCVEATNLFLFVGCTSGTIYVFSRDTLKLIFMIPFKGGKVCHLSATLDESDIAVASIRGRVSIYRISPNVHFMQSQSSVQQQSRSSSSPGESFKHLYDVPHHVKNEITEMQWSPNGKYLFIGDSQGLISQVDVASLEEFPRPPPSRVILKLQSRILQIDCTFPYMAVCTLSASYLCDLEKEDFTRIQTIDKKSDVKAAGLCLAILHNEDTNECNNSSAFSGSPKISKESKMVLLLGELGSGCILHCKMDGMVSLVKKVKLAPGIQNSVTLFDPKVPVDTQLLYKEASVEELNFSQGKMLSTDDGLIVSVSSDRIFVYDAMTTNIILYNEDFTRINSFKIIANYWFIWHGNKLDVVAFTHFRSYGKQLLRAGLNSVLENWISYAIYSLGWKENVDNQQNTQNNLEDSELITEILDENIKPNSTKSGVKNAIFSFRQMMSPIEEDDDFCNFVSSHLPFPLIEPKIVPEEEESDTKRLQKAMEKLILSVKLFPIEYNTNNTKYTDLSKLDENYILSIWDSLEIFYKELGATLPQLDFKQSELTFAKVLNSIHTFLKQPQLINVKEDLLSTALSDSLNVEEVLKVIFKCFSNKNLFQLSENLLESTNRHCFTKYSDFPVVSHYFKEIGINSANLIYDAFLADTILLLAPFTSQDLLLSVLKESLNLNKEIINLFFTWMVLTTYFNNQDKYFSFGSLLRNLQNEQFFDKLAEDIVSCVYRDSILPRDEDLIHKQQHASKFLHHFITFVVLFSKSPDIKTRGLNLLVTLFPLTRGAKKDIIEKIISICALNPYLVKMYMMACVKDGKSMKLCECGIQACYGSLENMIPAYQRAIEEAVFISLSDEFLDFEVEANTSPNNSLKKGLKSLVHQFAMRRCLIQSYMESSISDEILSERMKIRMILRSGVCSGLSSLKFNLENLKIIRESLKNNVDMDMVNCSYCGMKLESKTTQIQTRISMDCVGVWIAENVHSIEKFMKIVKKIHLNSPGDFSLRFYRFLVKRDHLRKNKREDAGFGDLVSLSSLTCSVLH